MGPCRPSNGCGTGPLCAGRLLSPRCSSSSPASAWCTCRTTTTAHVTIVPGGGKLGLATFGHPIKLPQQAVDAARTFIHTAVVRKNLDAGWRISTANVHAGLTHAQWMTGTIPVSPFPQDAYGETRYKVEWSRSKNVMLLALITPDKPGVKSGEFFIQMVPQGKTWLVDYFGPRGTNPPIPAARP